MSLTKFLRQPDVRERFRGEFAVPRIAVRKEPLAPPLSNRYGLVGTAFDYLLRFKVQRLNANAVCRRWVAEIGLARIPDASGDEDWFDIDEDVFHFAPEDPRYMLGREFMSRAKAAHLRFLSSGRVTENLIKASIFLAQLDFVYRSRYIDEQLGNAFPEDIEDLREMLRIVPSHMFISRQHCILNPTFGNGSRLVGGADADVIIDDTLIEVKTTKHLALKSEHFYQLLGYVILNRLGKIEGVRTKPRIARVAVYFSRYAHMEVFELRELISSRRFSSFVNWFHERAQQGESISA